MNEYENRSLEDEEYVLNLPYHLNKAGMTEPIFEILTDFYFLNLKINYKKNQDFIQDYNFALNSNSKLINENQDGFRAIQNALRKSDLYLMKLPELSWGQIYGRLFTEDYLPVRKLLSQKPVEPWLRPIKPSLSLAHDPLIRTLQGHNGYVTCLAVLPKHNQILSGSTDKTLKLWDLQTGECLRTFVGHEGTVEKILLVPNSSLAISCSADLTIKLWELSKEDCLKTFVGHKAEILDLKINKHKQIISASIDRNIKVWELETGQCVKNINFLSRLNLLRMFGRFQRVVKIFLKYLVLNQELTTRINSGLSPVTEENIRDSFIKLMSSNLKTKLFSLLIPKIVILPASNKAVSLDEDYTLKVWNIETGKVTAILKGHVSEIVDFQKVNFWRNTFSWMELIFSFDDSGILKIWDLSTGECIRTINTDFKYVENLCVYHGKTGFFIVFTRFLNFDKFFPWMGFEATLTRCDLNSDRCLSTISHNNRCTALNTFAFLKSHLVSVDGDEKEVGDFVISASETGEIKLWSLEDLSDIETFKGHTNKVSSLIPLETGFFNSQYRLLSSSYDGSIKIWQMLKSVNNEVRNEHSAKVSCLVFSPETDQAISGSHDFTLKCWDLTSGQILKTLEGHEGYINSIKSLSGSGRVASASTDCTVKIWDILSGQCLKTLAGHKGGVISLNYYRGMNLLFSGDSYGELRVWQIDTGECIQSFKGHQAWLRSIQVIADENKVISASSDMTIKIWNLMTGNCLTTFENENPLEILELVPELNLIVSGDSKGIIKTWNLNQEGHPSTVLEGHEAGIWDLKILSGTNQCLSASSDTTIRLWDIAKGESLKIFSGHDSSVINLATIKNLPLFISASFDGNLKLWDLNSGTCLTTYAGESEMLRVVTSSDETRIIAGEELGRIHILSLENIKNFN